MNKTSTEVFSVCIPTMQFFDGNFHSKKLDKKIQKHILNLNKNEIKTLLIIQIGENNTSKKYVSLKLNYCKKNNIPTKYIQISELLSDKEITSIVAGEIDSSDVGSVIIQLPLPRKSLSATLNLIPHEKDIDLLSSKSKVNFYSNQISFSSPVVRSCEYFIDSLNLQISNLNVCVIGAGELVGKPLAHMLANNGANVDIIEDYSNGRTLDYEFLILGVGKPGIIDPMDIKKDANVVDFGSSIVDNKTVGDLDISDKSRLDHLKNVSPSPGGMGPLVIRFLAMNHLGI